MALPVYIPTSYTGVPIYFADLFSFIVLMVAILIGGKCYLILVVIYGSLMVSDAERTCHVPMESRTYWPCLCLLWKNV